MPWLLIISWSQSQERALRALLLQGWPVYVSTYVLTLVHIHIKSAALKWMDAMGEWDPATTPDVSAHDLFLVHPEWTLRHIFIMYVGYLHLGIYSYVEEFS